jgi:hypothetical protein
MTTCESSKVKSKAYISSITYLKKVQMADGPTLLGSTEANIFWNGKARIPVQQLV